MKHVRPLVCVGVEVRFPHLSVKTNRGRAIRSGPKDRKNSSTPHAKTPLFHPQILAGNQEVLAPLSAPPYRAVTALPEVRCSDLGRVAPCH